MQVIPFAAVIVHFLLCCVNLSVNCQQTQRDCTTVVSRLCSAPEHVKERYWCHCANCTGTDSSQLHSLGYHIQSLCSIVWLGCTGQPLSDRALFFARFFIHVCFYRQYYTYLLIEVQMRSCFLRGGWASQLCAGAISAAVPLAHQPTPHRDH